MLERIHNVKGVGLLHDADGRQHAFQKATFYMPIMEGGNQR